MQLPPSIISMTLRLVTRLLFSLLALAFAAPRILAASTRTPFRIPADYLREPDTIPPFWVSTVDEVSAFLTSRVRTGKIEIIGTSAGGLPIRAVAYGQPRQGRGTSTFSGSLGFRNVRAYRGPDHEKTVYWAMAAVHGGEFDAIVGIVNLLSVIETGKDLRGKAWPGIAAAAAKLDRLMLIPILNPDGRARIPLRMAAHREGAAGQAVQEYLNTGANADGTLLGWPQVKEFIPLDFARTAFPGGYPNDAGVNIQHDDFFGRRQPETQALFDLAARERPDLVLNLHTGVGLNDYFMRVHRPLGEPALGPIFDAFFRQVHTGLALAGLQSTRDPAIEANPKRAPQGAYNLDTALNFHCGALSIVVESPSHGFSGNNRAREPARQTPDTILDAQLVLHEEAMKFLVATGGRARWTPGLPDAR
jgi:hypothetical protein